jgi:hypothetical protein
MNNKPSWLTDDDANHLTGRQYFAQIKEPTKLTLVPDDAYNHDMPTYSIKCPHCGADNHDERWIWPRNVTKNNERELRDSLDSNGDEIRIGFECEHCTTTYDLIIRKQSGLQIKLEKTGYKIYD